ncbi:hypothetical protein M6B38_146430 [Iris pallida]|uniref:Uncharacterized protein n=1 Tax=Iris pallida TaxID=29817 RepID=A0AAX6F9M9_IRIPA|nr:hypothetical protein M6B38_146430 [Iris pallida]
MVWRPPAASNRPGGELHGEAIRTWRRGQWLVDLRRSGSLLEVAAWKPKGARGSKSRRGNRGSSSVLKKMAQFSTVLFDGDGCR